MYTLKGMGGDTVLTPVLITRLCVLIYDKFLQSHPPRIHRSSIHTSRPLWVKYCSQFYWKPAGHDRLCCHHSHCHSLAGSQTQLSECHPHWGTQCHHHHTHIIHVVYIFYFYIYIMLNNLLIWINIDTSVSSEIFSLGTKWFLVYALLSDSWSDGVTWPLRPSSWIHSR